MNFLFTTSKRCSLFLLFFFFLAAHLPVCPASAAVPVNGTSALLNLDLKVLVAGKPIYFILVEKDFQRLRVLEHDGRLGVVAEYFAVTGENFGRKQIEGDEKTPEGVYFITKTYVDNKITVFGTRAFHLNYPNVYDQTDGRSGNGIYIHGTNKELRSNSTNGCITLNNSDLDDLSQYLSVGSIPVIVVSSLYDESGSKGLYPDLTENDFSLAKELLILGGKQDDLDFVSLYLIRAAGQTVVAGEYKAGKVASQSLYSAAYLDISQEKGWFVAERGPGSETVDTAPEELVTAVEDVVANSQQPSALGKEPWSELWEPKNEDIYLGWYRDSLSEGKAIVDIMVEEAQAQSSLPAAEQESGSKILYGLMVLSVCISVGSVLILRRGQPGHSVMEVDCKAEQKIARLTAEKLANEQLINAIQKELDRTNASILLVQEKLQEEKRSMEKDLELKIKELESELREMQSEVDKLSTEKAALKLKGMSHMSGQIEELGALKVELEEAKEQLAEARKESARLPVLESMITAQKDETNRLAAENAAWKMNEAGADADHRDEIHKFKNQIAALESQVQEEVERRSLIETQTLASAGLEQELAAAQSEAATLRQERDELRELHDANRQSELEQEITSLRGRVSVYKTELSSECEKNETLAYQLKMAQETEKKLSARTAALEQLERENSQLKEELAAKDHEDELVVLRQRLSSYEEEIASKGSENSELSIELQAAKAAQEELSALKAEAVNRLEQENCQLKEELAAKDHEEELVVLRQRLSSYEEEIASKGSENSELSIELQSAKAAQEELSALKAEAVNRLEQENCQLKEELAAKDHEDELVVLRNQLTEHKTALDEERSINARFENRLAKLSELEDFVLARQIEVTSLKNELEALKNKERMSSERVIGLQNQLDTLQTTLETERAQRLEIAEAVVADERPVVSQPELLYADIPKPQVQVEKTEIPLVSTEKASAIRSEAAPQRSAENLRYGTQFLPEDILKKWIGQG
nr:L,D-transpeptidase family protein [Desulfobulbaceae bacterium]